ncbi:helix-turn-helix domain-containing protein [Cohnella fermenti]|uniref:Helix-turn-helix transcriptional regulator n=1 Tax=Cohnella fermenti TaxID=2565925 RepID=A0A4S4BHH4_9BACL|nr:helix-turn-helix domain-containing protein [Cohnella fermenti]THF74007.1 helix-turn-helix transcriptional regulator [Cohnella fermenti]
MLRLLLVCFDDFIPTWRNYEQVIPMNVLALVTQGCVVYHLDGQRFEVQKGEVLFIPKGTNRAAQNDESGPHQKFTVLFDYETEGALSIPVLGPRTANRLRIRYFDYLKTRFTQLYQEYQGTGSLAQLISLNLLQEILLLVSREAELNDVSPIQLTLAKKIESYLMANYRQSIGIKQLSELIERSPNYTSSLFKDVTGQSPIQFIHNLRISEARRLLLHSNMTVPEISQHLGYYDVSHFIRMFKKMTMTTPTRFRARNEGNIW